MMHKTVVSICIYVSSFSPLTSAAYAQTSQVYIVCHGDHESTCKMHSYAYFEHCGDDNGVGGADPNATISYLCGTKPGGAPNGAARATQAPIAGDHCGYSWFEVRCY